MGGVVEEGTGEVDFSFAFLKELFSVTAELVLLLEVSIRFLIEADDVALSIASVAEALKEESGISISLDRSGEAGAIELSFTDGEERADEADERATSAAGTGDETAADTGSAVDMRKFVQIIA